MMPVDMRPVYLWMGLTHPLLGPANLAWYSSYMTYAAYVAWVEMLMSPLGGGDKDRRPG